MGKQLIVNADDYGRTAGVVEGILRAHQQGIVTSTTAMMNMPGIEAALQRAQSYPDLGLGIHLVFSAWRPLLPPERIPSLVDDDGAFLNQKSVAKNCGNNRHQTACLSTTVSVTGEALEREP
jgi:predicted glycoside hydrolase/deacetylase ChbG (UPF0249 family)